MTDWKFEYEHPPLTDEDWEAEFEKYKQSPEYKKANLGMTVDEYKFIYWMENYKETQINQWEQEVKIAKHLSQMPQVH